MLKKVLAMYGLAYDHFQLEPFGSGLINNTWKVSNDEPAYILQRINSNVFKSPKTIANNLQLIKKHLDLSAPEYLFVAPMETLMGDHMVEVNGKFFRLFPFIKGSDALESVSNSDQAYHAAKQFGRFTRMLDAFESSKLEFTINDFHNLPLRVAQFKHAVEICSKDRSDAAAPAIKEIQRHLSIAEHYEQIIEQGTLISRVIHHDTKISNVLFDKQTGEGLCVIDLDTVMQGYFISDVGDMMRTYLSVANEEETDLELVNVRVEIFAAIYQGYMEEMEDVLSALEKDLFIFSGRYMIYMQALRFLTDYLCGDQYFKTSYPEQNLNRAMNQIQLLNQYIQAEPHFEQAIKEIRIKSANKRNTV